MLEIRLDYLKAYLQAKDVLPQAPIEGLEKFSNSINFKIGAAFASSSSSSGNRIISQVIEKRFNGMKQSPKLHDDDEINDKETKSKWKSNNCCSKIEKINYYDCHCIYKALKENREGHKIWYDTCLFYNKPPEHVHLLESIKILNEISIEILVLEESIKNQSNEAVKLERCLTEVSQKSKLAHFKYGKFCESIGFNNITCKINENSYEHIRMVVQEEIVAFKSQKQFFVEIHDTFSKVAGGDLEVAMLYYHEFIDNLYKTKEKKYLQAIEKKLQTQDETIFMSQSFCVQLQEDLITLSYFLKQRLHELNYLQKKNQSPPSGIPLKTTSEIQTLKKVVEELSSLLKTGKYATFLNLNGNKDGFEKKVLNNLSNKLSHIVSFEAELNKMKSKLTKMRKNIAFEKAKLDLYNFRKKRE